MKLGTASRDRGGVLSGETPVKYRVVFELSEAVKLRVGRTDRVELFTSDPDSFYWLQAVLSRMVPGEAPFTRAEAVILTDESKVVWTDRNPDEKD